MKYSQSYLQRFNCSLWCPSRRWPWPDSKGISQEVSLPSIFGVQLHWKISFLMSIPSSPALPSSKNLISLFTVNEWIHRRFISVCLEGEMCWGNLDLLLFSVPPTFLLFFLLLLLLLLLLLFWLLLGGLARNNNYISLQKRRKRRIPLADVLDQSTQALINKHHILIIRMGFRCAEA